MANFQVVTKGGFLIESSAAEEVTTAKQFLDTAVRKTVDDQVYLAIDLFGTPGLLAVDEVAAVIVLAATP